jgi:hypothetical protein
MTDQNQSLRFEDSTSQAHYYEADEWNQNEWLQEIERKKREQAFYDKWQRIYDNDQQDLF